MNAQFTQSLAGTQRRYVVGQTKVANNALHIQISGPSENRPYGFATELKVSEALVKFVKSQPASLHSFATGDKLYVPVQFSVQDDERVKAQFPGNNGNRAYGYVELIDSTELVQYLRRTEQPVAVAPATQNTGLGSNWFDADEEAEETQGTDTDSIPVEETIVELEESLNGIMTLLKSALDELALVKAAI